MTRSKTMSVCSLTGPKFSDRPTKKAIFVGIGADRPTKKNVEERRRPKTTEDDRHPLEQTTPRGRLPIRELYDRDGEYEQEWSLGQVNGGMNEL